MNANQLTPHQERFCLEYLIDLNPAKAAERVGCSPRNAPRQGSKWLTTQKVQQRVAELKKAASPCKCATTSVAAVEAAKDTLTPRQVRFAYEYLVDLNATKAAQRAGCTPSTAPARGSRWTRNRKVAALIAELKALRAERVLMNADDVLRELIPLCTSDVRNLISGDKLVSLQELQDAGPEISKSVQTVKMTEKFDQSGNPIVETEFKLHPKVTALALAGKHIDVRAFDHALQGSVPVHITVETGLGSPPGGNT